MKTYKRATILLALALCWGIASGLIESKASTRAADFAFMGLGDLPGGTFSSGALGVSADGTVVVGDGRSSAGVEAFVWRNDTGMIGLGDLPGGLYYSQSYAVSADGSVVVGQAVSDRGPEAFRWTQSDGLVPLGDLPGGRFDAAARDVSSDGSVVVGYSDSDSAQDGFYWTAQTGMIQLVAPAIAVSNDGSTVAGTSISNGLEAFLWTPSTAPILLADLPGGSFLSSANDISDDGSTVVGYSNSENGVEAFRWSQASGMTALRNLSGGDVYSIARGVSEDGAIVVGDSHSEVGDEAVIWDSNSNIARIKDLLLKAGLADQVAGWTLTGATGISDDGTIVVGTGFAPGKGSEAWLAVLPELEIPELSSQLLACVALVTVITCRGISRRRQ